jgi:hypothetical protein
MKLKRELLNKHERMANKYRYSKDNWIEVRNSTQLSKSKHPSQTRQIHGENSSLEIRNNKKLGIKSRNGDN